MRRTEKGKGESSTTNVDRERPEIFDDRTATRKVPERRKGRLVRARPLSCVLGGRSYCFREACDGGGSASDCGCC